MGNARGISKADAIKSYLIAADLEEFDYGIESTNHYSAILAINGVHHHTIKINETPTNYFLPLKYSKHLIAGFVSRFLKACVKLLSIKIAAAITAVYATVVFTSLLAT